MLRDSSLDGAIPARLWWVVSGWIRFDKSFDIILGEFRIEQDIILLKVCVYDPSTTHDFCDGA
jgi:hypothetical protein